MQNRRSFLFKSTFLVSGILAGQKLLASKKKPLLAFSTLGCPGWTFPRIVEFANKNGYQGLELRGILKEMDLTRVPELSEVNLAATKRLIAGNGLKIVSLGSSAELHHLDATKRKENLEGAVKYIDLAAALECPYVRVFPNALPSSQDRQQTLMVIASGLKELGAYAAKKGVTVLMETHGDVVWSADILNIMQQAGSVGTGLIWDFYNMWSITKEDPSIVYERLHPFIRHIHVKDSRRIEGKENYVLLGQGESPVGAVVRLLEKRGYKGYYSFEWEKRWHPEIAEPEVALAHFPDAFKRYFS